jgi:hypothetical protein
MYYCYFDTPIGELLLAGEGDGLSMIGFPKGSTTKSRSKMCVRSSQNISPEKERILICH